MSNTKRACIAYGLLWTITIILRWIVYDPEGFLSDLITYWIVHPLAIVVVAAFIASEGMTLKKWLLPIGLGMLYSLIHTFTGQLRAALNNHNHVISINLELLRNGLLFALIGTVVGIIIYRIALKRV